MAVDVIVDHQLTFTDHISSLLVFCLMRVLSSHGLHKWSLHDVFRATLMANIGVLSCTPAFSGFFSAAYLRKPDLLRCCKNWML